MPLIDLTGQTFGRLTVIERVPARKNQHTMWRCLCSCGNECDADSSALRAGTKMSCGCLRAEMNAARKAGADLTGQTFGLLTVIERAGSGGRGKPLWRCRCQCGAEKIVYGHTLRGGSVKSCGCLRRENARTIKYNWSRKHRTVPEAPSRLNQSIGSERKCPVCKKPFLLTSPQWGWRFEQRYLCSYHCMRTLEKQKYQK